MDLVGAPRAGMKDMTKEEVSRREAVDSGSVACRHHPSYRIICLVCCLGPQYMKALNDKVVQSLREVRADARHLACNPIRHHHAVHVCSRVGGSYLPVMMMCNSPVSVVRPATARRTTT